MQDTTHRFRPTAPAPAQKGKKLITTQTQHMLWKGLNMFIQVFAASAAVLLWTLLWWSITQ